MAQTKESEHNPSRVKVLEEDFSQAAEDKPLWLEIVRFLGMTDLEVIGNMPEFQKMVELVMAERHTVDDVVKCIQNCSTGYPYEGHPYSRLKLYEGHPYSRLNLDGFIDSDRLSLLREVESTKNFWYMWVSKNESSFGTVAKFSEFCGHAGVDLSDPSGYFQWRHYHCLLSKDEKVTFLTNCNPRNIENIFYDIWMIGKRERIKWLASWLSNNTGWTGHQWHPWGKTHD